MNLPGRDEPLSLNSPLKRFDGSTLILSLEEVIDMVNLPEFSRKNLMERLNEFEKLTGVDFDIRLGFVVIPFEDDASMMEFYLRWMTAK